MDPRNQFQTITIEGGLLSHELLSRLGRFDASITAISASDYHLPKGQRLRDTISRSWTDLSGCWETFESIKDKGHSGALTRKHFLLTLFERLGFGILQSTKEFVIGENTYPISHLWGQIPIHLLEASVDLTARVKGGPSGGASPFSMLQTFLNRSDEHLWAILSNGKRLRLLRDNPSLSRAAYIEFDLEAMFEGKVFNEFVILWMLCHESRFEGSDPSECILERWLQESRERGIRALDNLRDGFKKAIETLGKGFISYPGNTDLKNSLREGKLSTTDYHRQILRLTYRLVFLLVAEDRNLLHPQNTKPSIYQRYSKYYSISRIREQAAHNSGSKHCDMFASLQPVFKALARGGLSALGLPELGSFLWQDEACPDIIKASLANHDLMSAIRHLAYISYNKILQRVDFANLGPEELGSVYESLLELHPRINIDAGGFELTSATGNERKSTGSYYTPTSLISALLDSTLDPLLDEKAAGPNPINAILEIKIIDPACGSGHFLVAAARRMAGRLAQIETGELSPPPSEVQNFLREVVSKCIYGIDLNPMALELAKVNLWLEAMNPGHPLNFLDSHLICGNALVGATPDLIENDIPDEAFKALTGDDKQIVMVRKKANANERKNKAQGTLDLDYSLGNATKTATKSVTEFEEIPDDTPEDIHKKEQLWDTISHSPETQFLKKIADTWCAAFFAEKTKDSPTITSQTLRNVLKKSKLEPGADALITELADRYHFLHPHIAFPNIFTKGTSNESGTTKGGFDIVLANPPWEKMQLSEKEFFASRDPKIAELPGDKRKKAIAELKEEDQKLYGEYKAALRGADCESHFLHNSGRYPLCGRNRINTYAVFAELMRSLIAPGGRAGAILPTGIATDDGTKEFFQAIIGGELVSLYDFENRKQIFPGVHRSYKFSLLTLTRNTNRRALAKLAFFCQDTKDLNDEERLIELEEEDIKLLNPNTMNCPIFRSKRDAEITLGIYKRMPVLIKEGEREENPWQVSFLSMFNMTSDSGLFRTRKELEESGGELEGNIFRLTDKTFLPLYEAKMIHQFDHRWAGYQNDKDVVSMSVRGKCDLDMVALPLYWVDAVEVENRLQDWKAAWLCSFRNITNATNERTVISALIPRVAVGNSLPLMRSNIEYGKFILLQASLSSLALDFAARQKVGGVNLNLFIVKQLPVLPPETYDTICPWDNKCTFATWLMPRILELTYTAHDMATLAKDLGYEGQPFAFDEERRSLIRSEMDACFFYLYGLSRDEISYVLDTFPIIKEREEKSFGEYRIKRLILTAYDAMMRAVEGGEVYESPLSPPPGEIS